MYSVPLPASTPSCDWGFQAPEIVGGQGRRGPHVWEMTGIHGERVWGVARCCLPRSPGQPQHYKYQNRIWWWWYLSSFPALLSTILRNNYFYIPTGARHSNVVHCLTKRWGIGRGLTAFNSVMLQPFAVYSERLMTENTKDDMVT